MVRIFNFRAYFSLLTRIKDTLGAGGGGGEGGREGERVLNKCLYGEAPPRDPTPYTFTTIFYVKGTPFVYLLLTNGISFTDLI